MKLRTIFSLKDATKLLSMCVLMGVVGSCQAPEPKEENATNDPEFKGKIALDIRDSEEDWTPYTPKSAPEGAPNILFILYD